MRKRPELTDRVVGPVVDFVQQNRWAFVEKVGAQGRDRGGGATDVEPEGREKLPTKGWNPREALDAPRGPKSLPCGGFLIPGSLSMVPFPYLTEFFDWHFPEYKILENKRLCGQIR